MEVMRNVCISTINNCLVFLYCCVLYEEEAGNTECPYCNALKMHYMVSTSHLSVDHTEERDGKMPQKEVEI